MPRPEPLSNTSNSYPRFDTQLTPRTPHSRAGRAEEAYTAAELEQIDFDGDDDYGSIAQQQNAPLLSSSASDSFPQVGYRSQGDDYDESTAKKGKRLGLTADKIISRLPLALYSSVAAVLLVLVFFSLREPEVLKKYVGATDASDVPTSDLEPAPTAAVDLEPIVPEVPHAHMQMPDGVELVSYENYTNFPLDPIEYRDECIKLTSGPMPPRPYWVSRPLRDVPHIDEQLGYELPPGEAPICNRTITYQLDGWAGLISDLALIAQAAALAREREATFFVDDRFWNRGKWTDHFEPVRVGPEPGCRPPPPDEYVACPRTARHWILNSRTSRYHFGHGFSDNYENPYGHDLNRLKDMFNFSWESMRTTIRPNAQSKELIQWAREELQVLIANHYQNPRSIKGVQADGPAMSYIGLHIRRGDRLAQWRAYGSYVPLTEYVQGVVDTGSRLGLELPVEDKPVQPFTYIASDSPAAIDEFSSSFSQDRVFSLSASKRQELRELASQEPYVQNDFMALEEDVRVRATRGMVVDFALLSGAWAQDGDLIPDATVCAVSSVVCKMAAVGLGWKRAFGEVNQMGEIEEATRRWVDVDSGGRIVPVWEAYQAY